MFFDDLRIAHKSGPILEETHYYPFGLTIKAISSKALNRLENRYKFNDGTEFSNNEFTDGSGLEWYETPFRGYDPQLGRFWQIDAMFEDYEFISPYNFSLNNPIVYNDPSGLNPVQKSCPDCEDEKIEMLPEVTVLGSYKNNWDYNVWALFVDNKKHYDQVELYRYLQNQGVNDDALRLFNKAWQNIGYRERRREIEKNYRESVEEILVTIMEKNPSSGPVSVSLKVVRSGYKLGKMIARMYAAGKNAAKGGTYTVENIAGFYVRSASTISKGTYTRTIQTLASLSEGTSIPKLLKVFESQARAGGANKIVLNGIDIVETRLINAQAAQRLGYTFEQTSTNSIRLTKILK